MKPHSPAKNLRSFGLLAWLALAVCAGTPLSNLRAVTVTTATNYAVNLTLPDGNPAGVTSAKTFTTPITSIQSMKVTLEISGGWNGDLYAILQHDSGFVVLLNRAGRTATNSVGYSHPGLGLDAGGAAFTFADTAAFNVHAYGAHAPVFNGNGQLTGSWQPDGRTNSPVSVLDSDPPATALSSFTGLNPNGTWVLYVADLASGDIATWANWGLEITGLVPDRTVTGLVELEQFVGMTRDVTFVATGGTTGEQPLQTNVVTLAFTNNGSGVLYAPYSFLVPANTTNLSAKTAWNLRRRQPVAFSGGVLVADFIGARALPAGDLNGSNRVDVEDYFQLASLWYQRSPVGAAADLDGNGLVDLDDYFLLANRWYVEGDPE